jgi:predicted nucleic acid-binding protein
VRFLVDSDAFLVIRRWKVLDVDEWPAGVSLVMTGYAARHELNDVQADVNGLEELGHLRVEQVFARTPAYERFRQLRNAGADKGEAEAIAWAMGQEAHDRPCFISVDREARAHAVANGLAAGDVMDLVVRLVGAGAMSIDEARVRLAPWDDRKQFFGRPADYTTFDETYGRRR